MIRMWCKKNSADENKQDTHLPFPPCLLCPPLLQVRQVLQIALPLNELFMTLTVTND